MHMPHGLVSVQRAWPDGLADQVRFDENLNLKEDYVSWLRRLCPVQQKCNCTVPHSVHT